MSQENVDVVRAMCSAFIGGDVAGSFERLHPEVEFHSTIGGLEEGQVVVGHKAVAVAFVENREMWESLVHETEGFFDAGDDVVVFWHEIARSRHSEAEMETRTASVCTVRDGMVVAVRPYMDRDVALEAAGLSDRGDLVP